MATVMTPVTDMLHIKHPLLLAGMGVVSGPKLAAAVSNSGGLGVIGGIGYKPDQLRAVIRELKDLLDDPTAFGVDLLLPKVGGSARRTNYDYTGGQLSELIDVIVQEKARLFVSAVGVPPTWVVEKLHAGGVLCANMVGHPKHVEKALAVGMDMIIAQGYEAGGHTGDVATMCLIPQCVDACRGKISQFTQGPVHVVAAGGIVDGRSMGAALMLGAQAVWVGTRFVACTEANVTKFLLDGLLAAGPTDAARSLIWTGRPLRSLRTEYARKWESDEALAEVARLTQQGIIPYEKDMEDAIKAGKPWSQVQNWINPAGQCAGSIDSAMSAKEIIDEMVAGCVETMAYRSGQITQSKL